VYILCCSYCFWSCHQQGHAGSKTLHEQNPPVLNWRCRLTQVDLYNGRKMVLVVVVVVLFLVLGCMWCKVDCDQYCSVLSTALTPSAHYEQVMTAFGGKGYFAETTQQVRDAFMACLADRQSPSLINIVISPTTGRKPQVNCLLIRCCICATVMKLLVKSYMCSSFFIFSYGFMW